MLAVKTLPANAGDTCSIPESRKSPGVRNGNLLQYSWLEYSMDRRAWQATVRGVAKSQTWLKQLSMHITWKAKNQKTNPKSLAVLGKTYYFAFHPHLLLSDTCSVLSLKNCPWLLIPPLAKCQLLNQKTLNSHFNSAAVAIWGTQLLEPHFLIIQEGENIFHGRRGNEWQNVQGK